MHCADLIELIERMEEAYKLLWPDEVLVPSFTIATAVYSTVLPDADLPLREQFRHLLEVLLAVETLRLGQDPSCASCLRAKGISNPPGRKAQCRDPIQ